MTKHEAADPAVRYVESDAGQQRYQQQGAGPFGQLVSTDRPSARPSAGAPGSPPKQSAPFALVGGRRVGRSRRRHE